MLEYCYDIVFLCAATWLRQQWLLCCLWLLICSYVMGIGEAEAFSERLKRELLALEAANVHAILESEPLIDEVVTFVFFSYYSNFHLPLTSFQQFLLYWRKHVTASYLLCYGYLKQKALNLLIIWQQVFPILISMSYEMLNFPLTQLLLIYLFYYEHFLLHIACSMAY